MDQTTKQRLVGAIVLVGAILWIVPVFLDGPAEEPATISETVELPGVSLNANQRETVDLTPARVPASTTLPRPADSKPEEKKAEAAPEPKTPTITEPPKQAAVTEKAPEKKPVVETKAPEVVKTPPAAESKTPPPAVSTGSNFWAVQLGSFSSKENAERLAASLRKQGMAAFLTELGRDGTTLHRVRVGPVATREAAEKLVADLNAKGHKGQVVSHP